MKRVISLLLCLVLACGMLVSCGDPVIGGHAPELREEFEIPPEQRIALKLYIVYDEADEAALTEVERRINALTESEYNTSLDVVYLLASEYDAAVKAAVAKNNDADPANDEAAIVLINSTALMMDLYGDGSEVTIVEHYDPKQATADAPVVRVETVKSMDGTVTVTKYNSANEAVEGSQKDSEKVPISRQVSVGNLQELTDFVRPGDDGKDAPYGLLNAKIASALMNEAELPYDAIGVSDAFNFGLFCIPNNHLIDGTNAYTYLKINRQACEIWLNYTADELRAIDTVVEMDALKEELRAMLTANGADPAMADEYVKLVNGSCATKAEFESDEKYIMNVITYPSATQDDVFSGAFAVLKGTDADRAMRIINAINLDADLRNLLQYGIKDTHYTLEDGYAKSIELEGKKYDMNLLYTGNAFTAHYCEAENWTEQVKAFAEQQNKAALEQLNESVYENLRLIYLYSAYDINSDIVDYIVSLVAMRELANAAEVTYNAAKEAADAADGQDADLNAQVATAEAAMNDAKAAVAAAQTALEAAKKTQVDPDVAHMLSVLRQRYERIVKEATDKKQGAEPNLEVIHAQLAHEKCAIEFIKAFDAYEEAASKDSAKTAMSIAYLEYQVAKTELSLLQAKYEFTMVEDDAARKEAIYYYYGDAPAEKQAIVDQLNAELDAKKDVAAAKQALYDAKAADLDAKEKAYKEKDTVEAKKAFDAAKVVADSARAEMDRADRAVKKLEEKIEAAEQAVVDANSDLANKRDGAKLDLDAARALLVEQATTVVNAKAAFEAADAAYKAHVNPTPAA